MIRRWRKGADLGYWVAMLDWVREEGPTSSEMGIGRSVFSLSFFRCVSVDKLQILIDLKSNLLKMKCMTEVNSITMKK